MLDFQKKDSYWKGMSCRSFICVLYTIIFKRDTDIENGKFDNVKLEYFAHGWWEYFYTHSSHVSLFLNGWILYHPIDKDLAMS